MNSPVKDALRMDDWGSDGGQRWLQYLDVFESMIAPIGEALLARCGFCAGERVVDIGCGGGASARAIARQVAPAGGVTGIDISAALIAEARRRAAAAEVKNVQFVVADAATVQPAQAPFDRLHSRFGSMFFAEPAAAFRNLGRMVRIGGRADFAVWAPAADNPWVAELMGVLRRHVDLPAPDPRAPGPFALGDRDYFSGLLRDGGFGDIDLHSWHGTQWIAGPGASAAAALDFVGNGMSIGATLRQLPPALHERVTAQLLALFQARESAQGIGFPAHALLVTARRSG
ncbi:MAG: class I SAM-dependent methyltransferase [Steroidobacteraceae bacterium]